MLSTLLVALAAPMIAAASNACADPSVSAAATALGGNGSLNTYDIAITVRNTGSGAQAASLLQSVAIYQNTTKVDQKGVPPLKPGASRTVHYRMQRATDARAGSTHFRLVLQLTDPHGVPVTNCSTANDTARLDV